MPHSDLLEEWASELDSLRSLLEDADSLLVSQPQRATSALPLLKKHTAAWRAWARENHDGDEEPGSSSSSDSLASSHISKGASFGASHGLASRSAAGAASRSLGLAGGLAGGVLPAANPMSAIQTGSAGLSNPKGRTSLIQAVNNAFQEGYDLQLVVNEPRKTVSPRYILETRFGLSRLHARCDVFALAVLTTLAITFATLEPFATEYRLAIGIDVETANPPGPQGSGPQGQRTVEIAYPHGITSEAMKANGLREFYCLDSPRFVEADFKRLSWFRKWSAGLASSGFAGGEADLGAIPPDKLCALENLQLLPTSTYRKECEDVFLPSWWLKLIANLLASALAFVMCHRWMRDLFWVSLFTFDSLILWYGLASLYLGVAANLSDCYHSGNPNASPGVPTGSLTTFAFLLLLALFNSLIVESE